VPDLSITVCGREFPVSCGEGEEQYLRAAAALLDAESKELMKRDERLTEQKVLLMAGLVLADRPASLQRDLRVEKERVVQLENAVAKFEQEARVPVSAVPETVVESFSEVAARAEVLATMAEEKASS